MNIAIYRSIILLTSVLATQAALVVAVIWTATKLHPEYHMARWGLCYVIVSGVYFVLAHHLRAIRPENVLRPLRSTLDLFPTVLIALCTGSLVFWSTAPDGVPSMRLFGTALGLGMLSILAVQVVLFVVALPVLGIRRKRGFKVILLGNNDRSRGYLQRSMDESIVPVEILGYLDVEHSEQAGHRTRAEPWKFLGDASRLGHVLLEQPVDEVWIVLPIRSCYEEIRSATKACRLVGVPVRFNPELFDTDWTEICGTDGRAERELYYVHGPYKPWKVLVKRFIDIAVSATLLLVLCPFLLLVALAIKLGSAGPAFYRQTRSGLHVAPFTLYKFRTMIGDAELQRSELQALNEAAGPVFKMRDDPRITALGRVLRRTSIDELPQLWNVLRGEMSLVGPRPPLPEEVANYAPWQRSRLAVLPGITCVWQISGRSEIPFEQWMAMDLDYVASWSLTKDLVILLRTVPAVLSMRGAR